MVTRLLEPQMARFVVVGGSAAGAFFVLSYVFVAWIGLPPFPAAALAYAIAFVGSYLTQRAWTFGGARTHRHALPRYLAAQALCALVAACVAHYSMSAFDAPPLLMSMLATITAAGISYLISSRWVFS